MEDQMAGVPVLVMIPHSSIPHRITAKLREVGEHLSKPVVPGELRKKVSQLLGGAL